MGSIAELFQHLMNGLTLGESMPSLRLATHGVWNLEVHQLRSRRHTDGWLLHRSFIFNAIRGQVIGPWTMVAFFVAMAGMLFSAALGMLIERIAYKPLRNATRLAPLLSAIGVSFILSNMAAWMWGTKSRKLEYPFDNTPIEFKGISITPHQILILVVVVIMMIALKLFVDHSRIGKAMRATSLDRDTAKLMGIKADRIIAITFAIGSALAATAGFLIALEIKVYPSMGTMTGLKAFVAAVVGGIGNISGAMVGGILLGLLETLGCLAWDSLRLRDTIAFIALIIILLVKPEGLLGKAEKEKV